MYGDNELLLVSCAVVPEKVPGRSEICLHGLWMSCFETAPAQVEACAEAVPAKAAGARAGMGRICFWIQSPLCLPACSEH